MAEKAAFLNMLRSLFNIDGYMLPELTADQQSAFVRDPVRYLISTDKAQSDAILREVMKRQPAKAAAWIERKVRKGTDEHRTYLSARFPRGGGAPSPFDFDGHKWRYYATSFDDLGEFDIIHRPSDAQQVQL